MKGNGTKTCLAPVRGRPNSFKKPRALSANRTTSVGRLTSSASAVVPAGARAIDKCEVLPSKRQPRPQEAGEGEALTLLKAFEQESQDLMRLECEKQLVVSLTRERQKFSEREMAWNREIQGLLRENAELTAKFAEATVDLNRTRGELKRMAEHEETTRRLAMEQPPGTATNSTDPHTLHDAVDNPSKPSKKKYLLMQHCPSSCHVMPRTKHDPAPELRSMIQDMQSQADTQRWQANTERKLLDRELVALELRLGEAISAKSGVESELRQLQARFEASEVSRLQELERAQRAFDAEVERLRSACAVSLRDTVRKQTRHAAGKTAELLLHRGGGSSSSKVVAGSCTTSLGPPLGQQEMLLFLRRAAFSSWRGCAVTRRLLKAWKKRSDATAGSRTEEGKKKMFLAWHLRSKLGRSRRSSWTLLVAASAKLQARHQKEVFASWRRAARTAANAGRTVARFDGVAGVRARNAAFGCWRVATSGQKAYRKYQARGAARIEQTRRCGVQHCFAAWQKTAAKASKRNQICGGLAALAQKAEEAANSARASTALECWRREAKLEKACRSCAALRDAATIGRKNKIRLLLDIASDRLRAAAFSAWKTQHLATSEARACRQRQQSVVARLAARQHRASTLAACFTVWRISANVGGARRRTELRELRRGVVHLVTKGRATASVYVSKLQMKLQLLFAAWQLELVLKKLQAATLHRTQHSVPVLENASRKLSRQAACAQNRCAVQSCFAAWRFQHGVVCAGGARQKLCVAFGEQAAASVARERQGRAFLLWRCAVQNNLRRREMTLLMQRAFQKAARVFSQGARAVWRGKAASTATSAGDDGNNGGCAVRGYINYARESQSGGADENMQFLSSPPVDAGPTAVDAVEIEKLKNYAVSAQYDQRRRTLDPSTLMTKRRRDTATPAGVQHSDIALLGVNRMPTLLQDVDNSSMNHKPGSRSLPLQQQGVAALATRRIPKMGVESGHATPRDHAEQLLLHDDESVSRGELERIFCDSVQGFFGSALAARRQRAKCRTVLRRWQLHAVCARRVTKELARQAAERIRQRRGLEQQVLFHAWLSVLQREKQSLRAQTLHETVSGLQEFSARCSLFAHAHPKTQMRRIIVEWSAWMKQLRTARGLKERLRSCSHLHLGLGHKMQETATRTAYELASAFYSWRSEARLAKATSAHERELEARAAEASKALADRSARMLRLVFLQAGQQEGVFYSDEESGAAGEQHAGRQPRHSSTSRAEKSVLQQVFIAWRDTTQSEIITALKTERAKLWPRAVKSFQSLQLEHVCSVVTEAFVSWRDRAHAQKQAEADVQIRARARDEATHRLRWMFGDGDAVRNGFALWAEVVGSLKKQRMQRRMHDFGAQKLRALFIGSGVLRGDGDDVAGLLREVLGGWGLAAQQAKGERLRAKLEKKLAESQAATAVQRLRSVFVVTEEQKTQAVLSAWNRIAASEKCAKEIAQMQAKLAAVRRSAATTRLQGLLGFSHQDEFVGGGSLAVSASQQRGVAGFFFRGWTKLMQRQRRVNAARKLFQSRAHARVLRAVIGAWATVAVSCVGATKPALELAVRQQTVVANRARYFAQWRFAIAASVRTRLAVANLLTRESGRERERLSAAVLGAWKRVAVDAKHLTVRLTEMRANLCRAITERLRFAFGHDQRSVKKSAFTAWSNAVAAARGAAKDATSGKKLTDLKGAIERSVVRHDLQRAFFDWRCGILHGRVERFRAQTRLDQRRSDEDITHCAQQLVVLQEALARTTIVTEVCTAKIHKKWHAAAQKTNCFSAWRCAVRLRVGSRKQLRVLVSGIAKAEESVLQRSFAEWYSGLQAKKQHNLRSIYVHNLSEHRRHYVVEQSRYLRPAMRRWKAETARSIVLQKQNLHFRADHDRNLLSGYFVLWAQATATERIRLLEVAVKRFRKSLPRIGGAFSAAKDAGLQRVVLRAWYERFYLPRKAAALAREQRRRESKRLTLSVVFSAWHRAAARGKISTLAECGHLEKQIAVDGLLKRIEAERAAGGMQQCFSRMRLQWWQKKKIRAYFVGGGPRVVAAEDVVVVSAFHAWLRLAQCRTLERKSNNAREAVSAKIVASAAGSSCSQCVRAAFAIWVCLAQRRNALLLHSRNSSILLERQSEHSLRQACFQTWRSQSLCDRTVHRLQRSALSALRRTERAKEQRMVDNAFAHWARHLRIRKTLRRRRDERRTVRMAALFGLWRARTKTERAAEQWRSCARIGAVLMPDSDCSFVQGTSI